MHVYIYYECNKIVCEVNMSTILFKNVFTSNFLHIQTGVQNSAAENKGSSFLEFITLLINKFFRI